MLPYLVRRLALIVPLLLGITVISFLIMKLAPGEPGVLEFEMTPEVGVEARARLRALYGLDQPLHVQYWSWLRRIARLDFGHSFAMDRRPVLDKILERLPRTLTINILSLGLILLVALPIGIYSATHRYSPFDKVTTVLVFVGYAVPTFWLALLLMMLFGVHLGWLPISGFTSLNFASLSLGEKVVDLARHLLLPVFVSAFAGLAGYSRFMRGNMLEVIRQDYITTARAKGLPEGRVVLRHAVRNALLPIVTLLGLSLPHLIGGSVIFESIFAIPGIGQLFFASVMARDYPVIMGLLVMGSFLTMVGNLLADLCYALVDPRIRVG
ncbi:MAG: ABC transporter permease [Deltaproteobacteria bacterium]|nr:ABC transporter permease [Deltaproteobacteria bacterium]MBI3079727.1 ABC transporter permease [Deltaproteobacteria bacterium]